MAGKGAITNLTEDWNGHSLQEVEDFLKEQIAEISGAQTISLAINVLGDKIINFTDSDQEITFECTVNSKVSGSYSPNFTVYIKVGNTTSSFIPTGLTSEEDVIKSENIKLLLDKVSTENIPVEIWAQNGEKKSNVVTLNYKRNKALVQSLNNITDTNPNVLKYYVQYSGNKATLRIRYYSSADTNEESIYYLEQVETITAQNEISITIDKEKIPSKNYDITGVHKIETQLILTNEIESNIIVDRVFFYDESEPKNINYIIYDEVTDAIVTKASDINYIVYNPYKLVNQPDATTEVTFVDLNNNITINKANVVSGIFNTFKCIIPESPYKLKITAGSGNEEKSATMTINAVDYGITWKIPEGYSQHWDATGITNDSLDDWKWYATKEVLVDNKWTVQKSDKYFEVINKYTPGAFGFHEDHVTLGINYKFLSNYQAFTDNSEYGVMTKGYTFSITFKRRMLLTGTQNILLTNDYYIRIINGELVIRLGSLENITNDIYIGSLETKDREANNYTFIPLDTVINLIITVEPYSSNTRLISVYKNGELSARIKNEVSTINSSGYLFDNKNTMDNCLDVYNIYEYQRCLNDSEAMQLAFYSLGNNIDIIDKYKQNNFYHISDGKYVITLEDALNYGKYKAGQGHTNFAVVCSTDFRTSVIGTTSVYDQENTQNVYIYRFKQDSYGVGVIDADNTFRIEGKAGALRIRKQGTSTADIYKSNVRIDVRGTCDVYKWNSINGRFNDTPDEQVTKGAKIWKIGNTYPCSLLTLKKNANESTHARNLPTSRWYETCSRTLAAANYNKYADVLTPPQRKELDSISGSNIEEKIAAIKTRQCIDGIPGVGFLLTRTADPEKLSDLTKATTSFAGQFDLITDKKNMNVFGFTDASKEYSIEIRDNYQASTNVHVSNFKDMGYFKEDGTAGPRYYEYRFPDVDDSEQTQYDKTIGFGKDTPFQKLMDFVCNCSPHNIGYKYDNGAESVNNNKITIEGEEGEVEDTIENRRKKFHAEFYHYVVVNQFLLNALMIEWGLMIDQDVKNQFFTHFIGDTNNNNEDVLRLLGYDMDTSWGMDNRNFITHTPLELYDDGVYDGKHNPETDNQGHGSERGSDLWQLVYDCFFKEMKEIAEILSSRNLLNSAGIIKLMFDDHIDIYNELIYNNNAVYSYPDKDDVTDYKKIHGSDRQTLVDFIKKRCTFIGGKYYAVNSGFTDYENQVYSFTLQSTGLTKEDKQNREFLAIETLTDTAKTRLPHALLLTVATLDANKTVASKQYRGWIHYVVNNTIHRRSFWESIYTFEKKKEKESAKGDYQNVYSIPDITYQHLEGWDEEKDKPYLQKQLPHEILNTSKSSINNTSIGACYICVVTADVNTIDVTDPPIFRLYAPIMEYTSFSYEAGFLRYLSPEKYKLNNDSWVSDGVYSSRLGQNTIYSVINNTFGDLLPMPPHGKFYLNKVPDNTYCNKDRVAFKLLNDTIYTPPSTGLYLQGIEDLKLLRQTNRVFSISSVKKATWYDMGNINLGAVYNPNDSYCGLHFDANKLTYIDCQHHRDYVITTSPNVKETAIKKNRSGSEAFIPYGTSVAWNTDGSLADPWVKQNVDGEHQAAAYAMSAIEYLGRCDEAGINKIKTFIWKDNGEDNKGIPLYAICTLRVPSGKYYAARNVNAQQGIMKLLDLKKNFDEGNMDKLEVGGYVYDLFNYLSDEEKGQLTAAFPELYFTTGKYPIIEETNS